MAYVYKIYLPTIDKYYIGSSSGKYSDFWIKYFTSSKVINILRKSVPDDIWRKELISEFDNFEDAVNLENSLLRSIPKPEKKNYLNVNFSAGGAVVKSHTHVRIKTLENEVMFWPRDICLPMGAVKFCSNKPPSRKGIFVWINPTNQEKILSGEDETENGFIRKIDYDRDINNAKTKHRKTLKNVWITDGETNKRLSIDQTEIDTFKVPAGWKKGKTVNFPKNMVITDGMTKKYISSTEDIPDGWTRGLGYVNRTTELKIAINNGVTTKYIEKDLMYVLPKGWVYGGTSSGNTGKIKIANKDKGYIFINETEFDENIHEKYNKNIHDEERIKILKNYAENKVKLPKMHKNMSVKTLKKNLYDKIHST